MKENKKKDPCDLIRALVREEVDNALREKKRSQPYEEDLLDVPSFKERSVFVPHDIKKSIKKWAKDMRLDRR